MNRNIRRYFNLVIEYDGSAYNGWQIQPRNRTIQGAIQNALKLMTRQKMIITASGRTDAGVHALGQVANFSCRTSLGPETFQKGLNALLPNDIVILSCRHVPDTFHARYDAKSKVYHYRILNRNQPTAVGRQYAWFIRKALDVPLMNAGLKHIVGWHDFKAFEGAGSPRSHTVRHVIRARFFWENSDHLVFSVEANGFLRYMVRNLVGTLINVGLGKILPEEIPLILNSRDRSKAGITAPAHGLFLIKVNY